MSEKKCIKSLLPAELEAEMLSLGQPRYRAGQIFKWLHLGVRSFGEMSDLPRSLREQLSESYLITAPEILRKQVSSDGTVKYLYGLADGNSIESVLMKYEHGYSICISTQAGCRMGCVFCASYDPARSRDLSPAEILDQVLFSQADSGTKISNIVLMGTGEPLDNYENVLRFLELVNASGGVNIGMRHISLSTCGIIPRIYELAELKLQLTLSISLHAPTNELRGQIMPVNRTYDIRRLIEACRYYFEKTSRRISFEYSMIQGFNDTVSCAQKLAELLKGLPCHVNLIPLNKVEGSPLLPSGKNAIYRFQRTLEERGLTATVRRSLGRDISASCGQLRRQNSHTEV
ncbi:MAG: 23S rRNA (adenine(2503)-C(2))-methyltransferase RlmN [Clostridia bacterium]|nr:23S rRNA (adenine(2503)-C(2))-methyltransferase RlmN [Clostridia bacterium]